MKCLLLLQRFRCLCGARSLGSLLVVLSLSSCHRKSDTMAGAPSGVEVLRVVRGEVPEEFIAAGSIEAVDKAELGFLVAGRVLSLEVEDGAEVAKDQVLARLDSSDYRNTREIAEARLGELRSRYERLSRLKELGSLTDSDFDKIGSAVKEAEASAELARRQLSYTELRAPFAGRVVRRGLAVGQVVVPAQPVLTVLAPAPVWASVGVAEAEARLVQPGQAAVVSLATTGDRSFEGQVSLILPQADPLSRSFTVKIRLSNENLVLRPGNVVTARVFTGRLRKAILLPPQVVQRYPDGTLYVWTMDPAQHRVTRRHVDCGALRGSEVEILTGLSEGDQVVTKASQTLYEGMPLVEAFAK